MWDILWYPKVFQVHSLGLRANLIAIGNGKSLYRPSGTVFVELRHKNKVNWEKRDGAWIKL